MKKIILLFILLFVLTIKLQSQTIAGDYKVGDIKCTITIMLDEVRVYWDSVKGYSHLKYKENMITGEQIWEEYRKEILAGNFILLNDYSSGRYIKYPEEERFEVIRIK